MRGIRASRVKAWACLVHPMAFGAWTVFDTYERSASPMPAASVLRPLGLIAIGIALLLVLARPLVRPLPKRAILASFAVLLVSRYAQLKVLAHIAGLRTPFLEPILLLALLALLAGVTFGLRRSSSDMSLTTAIADIFAAVLAITAAWSAFGPVTARAAEKWRPATDRIIERNLSQPLRPGTEMPDIFYIILDGYARADTLQDRYDFDNRAFMAFLEARGFYVAERARSNYSQTYLSLASSLNFTYLDELVGTPDAQSHDRDMLDELISNNSVARLLRSVGYRFILLPSNYAATDASALADCCLDQRRGPTELENYLISLSMLDAVPAVRAWQHREHAQRIVRLLELLETPLPGGAPRFVFAHLLAPHPPFVFGPTGEFRIPSTTFNLDDGDRYPGPVQEYAASYRDQLQFVNARIERVIDAILAQPGPRPIIILQADHGSGMALSYSSFEHSDAAERLAIFSAYLAPDGIRAALYDTITPVNTFRVLFNGLFGTHWPLLEDKSYFSTWVEPYRFRSLPPESARAGPAEADQR